MTARPTPTRSLSWAAALGLCALATGCAPPDYPEPYAGVYDYRRSPIVNYPLPYNSPYVGAERRPGWGYATSGGGYGATVADPYCREALAEARDAARRAAITGGDRAVGRAERTRSYLERDC